MTKLQQAVDYLNDRVHFGTVSRLLFLADWHRCIQHGAPITDMTWSFFYGLPTTTLPRATSRTFLQHIFGRRRKAYALLTREDRASLDHVIKVTAGMSRAEISTLILSTYPCLHNDRTSPIDLRSMATAYRGEQLPCSHGLGIAKAA